MALSLRDVKRILNQVRQSTPSNDFNLIDIWTEYEGGNSKSSKLKYMCFEIEVMDPNTGETHHLYKAIKFARVERLPKSAKQSTSFMEMMAQVLSAAYEQGYNMVTVIANIIEPVPVGLLFLYGVQGVADTMEEAKKRADRDFKGFIGAMQGTFRVLHLRQMTAEEAEWLRSKMNKMEYMTAVRGIPKASDDGENAGNKGMGGSSLNPDAQGTLEEIITAMADYEYVIEVLSTPVYVSTLEAWNTKTQKQMTEWYGQLQGTKGLSFNISIPMMYMASTGMNQGYSRSYTDSTTQSYTQGESYNTGYSQNVGESLSQSLGESFGISQGENVSQSHGTSHSVSESVGQSQTVGYSEGISHSQSVGQTQGITQGISRGYSQGVSNGVSSGISIGNSMGQSLGSSLGTSEGVSASQGLSSNTGLSYGQGISVGESQNLSNSMNVGKSYGESLGSSMNVSQGQSAGISHSIGQNQSVGYGTSEGVSIGNSANMGESASANRGNSLNVSQGTNYGLNASGGVSSNAGSSMNHSSGVSWGENASGSVGNNYSHSDSVNSSTSIGGNVGVGGHTPGGSMGGATTGGAGLNLGGNIGHSSGVGESTSSGVSVSGSNGFSSGGSSSDSAGFSQSGGASFNSGGSYGNSFSASGGVNNSASYGQNASQGESIGYNTGISQNNSSGVSESYSTNDGVSYSQGYGASYGQNQGMSYSNGMSVGEGSSIGKSQNLSNSMSNGQSASYGNTQGTSMGQSASDSVSISITQNKGTSSTSSMSQSVTASESLSNSVSRSESLGQNYSNSISQGVSQSRGVTDGTSDSVSYGKSSSESYTQSVSNGTGKSWGESQSLSQGTSYGESNGRSMGTSLGTTGGYSQGTSGSMGIAPSIGYNKSYQWMDQQVKDILELLEYQNERLKKALRGAGAFYTYCYIACPDMNALATAQAAAKASWQNDFALTNPLQVLDLTPEEQSHLLYHFTAFSSDITRENVSGVSEYKYATVLLPNEYVAYTHLPRVSEGGIDTNINDVPKFRVLGNMQGNIYMGRILNAERYTFNNGYRTQFDYRLNIDELMHGMFVGQSRSGKTVAAMRFVKELAASRRTETGKRLRIVCLDPKQDWRGIARFVEPDRFRFYSMGNYMFNPINLNPCKIPRGVQPQYWIDGIINIYCRAYGLLERGKQMLSEVFYDLYEKAGVFAAADDEDWMDKVPELSKKISFAKVYQAMEAKKSALDDPSKGRAGNDTRDAYARLLERLSCFARPYSIERRLFSHTDEDYRNTAPGANYIGDADGYGVDELIGEDDVTVFESFGLESTFANFIFGIITSGFYKVAKGFEKGFLHPSQYETVLVIEEANKVLTGSDTAGTGGGGGMASLSGQSEFEEILDQSAGYGLFIVAITQKPSMMPSSIIANCGLLFVGRLTTPDDVNLAVRMIGREERIDDRDVVKWLPMSPTGWFICRSSRGYDFRNAEPVLVQIDPLNNASISNGELDAILAESIMRRAIRKADAAVSDYGKAMRNVRNNISA